MESQVKYSSLSQPPSIHASPIHYTRACNTAYNSPLGTSPYRQANPSSPYGNYQQYPQSYPQSYPQQAPIDSLDYQSAALQHQQALASQQDAYYGAEQQYNLTPSFNHPAYQASLSAADPQLSAAGLGSTYPASYSLNASPFPIADGTDPYHYGAQHPLQHSSHLHSVSQAQTHGFPFYDDPGSPIMDPHRDPMMTRPATAAGLMHTGATSREMRRRGLRSSYSLDRGDPLMAQAGMDPYGMGRDMTRDWSLERLDSMMNRQQAAQQAHLMGHHSRARDRSLERGMYLRDDPYLQQHAAQQMAANPMDAEYLRDPLMRTGQLTQLDRGGYSRDSFIAELQARLNELQTQYGHVKRELDATTQKLGSSMHSIKNFWSPELKKERAQRKEESAKYALLNDQLKILRAENQVIDYVLKDIFFGGTFD